MPSIANLWYAVAVPGEFDITTRYLVETYPADWMAFLGVTSSGPVRVVDANLTTVSAEVDKVLLVGEAARKLVHLEFQSSYDPTIGPRLLRYNATLHLPELLPVESILILLRPSADGPAIDGTYRVELPEGEQYMAFDYKVRRIWEEPAGQLLDGALGTLPLAPLGDVSREGLPALLRDVDRRFIAEAGLAEAARLRVVTYTLLGLRYPRDAAEQLMPGIRSMRDSSTYMAIVEEGLAEGRARGLAEGRARGLAEGRAEGRAEGERRLLLLFGESRLGPPDDDIRSRLEAIADADLLERLAARLLTVSSWSELLAEQP